MGSKLNLQWALTLASSKQPGGHLTAQWELMSVHCTDASAVQCDVQCNINTDIGLWSVIYIVKQYTLCTNEAQ